MGLQLRLLRKPVLVLVPAASVALPDTDQKHLSGRGAGAASAAVVPHGVVAAVAGTAGGAAAAVAAGAAAGAAAAAGGAAGGAAVAVGEGPAAALVAEDSRPARATAGKGVYWDLTRAAGTCLQ